MSNILEYFNIPKSGKTKQRIAIKDIIEQLNPSTQDKKILSSEIDSIYLVGVLDLDTIRIQSYIDEDYLYEAIYVIQVVLKTNSHFSTLNEKLHMAFPNPLVIVYQLDENMILSVAPKRINKNVKEKSVIEAIYTTNIFFGDIKHESFLEYLNLQNIKALNLKGFYELLTDYIYSERLIDLLGEYPKQIPNTSELKQTIKLIESENTTLNAYNESYKQASMMAEKMDIHMNIQKIEKNIENIILKLKEELVYE